MIKGYVVFGSHVGLTYSLYRNNKGGHGWNVFGIKPEQTGMR